VLPAGRFSVPIEFRQLVDGRTEIVERLPECSLVRLSVPAGADSDLAIEGSDGGSFRLRFDSALDEIAVDRVQPDSFHPGFPSRQSASRVSTAEQVDLTLLIDANSVEVFADDGEIVFTNQLFMSRPWRLTASSESAGMVSVALSILPVGGRFNRRQRHNLERGARA
jgi:sucrose-6-phosphate hydrolase SacC (GH32 family)